MKSLISVKNLLIPLLGGMALLVITATFSSPAVAMTVTTGATNTSAPVVLAWYNGPGNRYYYGGYRRGWGWGRACHRVCWRGAYGGVHCGTRCN